MEHIELLSGERPELLYLGNNETQSPPWYIHNDEYVYSNSIGGSTLESRPAGKNLAAGKPRLPSDAKSIQM